MIVERHSSRRILTTHTHPVREKVTRIRYQRDDATLNMRIQREIRMFQTQRAHKTECYTQSHGDGEREQEDPDSMEERGNVYVLAVELGEGSESKVIISGYCPIFEAISIYSLIHDDRDGIVEDTFAEDDAVQLRIDFVCVEDGQNGYRIGSGQS